MTADQWFGIAMALLNFSFWIAGAGIVIALIGLLMQAGGIKAQDDEDEPAPSLWDKLREWLDIAFKRLFDTTVPATDKIVALGVLVFLIGIALLVAAIIPGLIGLAQLALANGSSPSQTPTPAPTPSAT